MEDPHLLIVDDDERIRALLTRFLRRQGFLVTAAADAIRARRLLAGLAFDLIVLDVMMPGEDGVSLTRDLRKTGGTAGATPILLLTARGETGDRIAGLEAGADDYLAKPFDPKELVLRINAILRRSAPDLSARQSGQARLLRLGPLLYDAERGELRLAGGAEAAMALGPDQTARHLTVTEGQLMRILAADPGTTVTRARLVEALRGPNAARDPGDGIDALAQERAIDVQITRLRRKIEPDPREPRYLQTVRGAGYRLAPD